MRQALLAMVVTCALPAAACTTFCLRDGPVFGRNYDYYFGDAMIFVNPRGVEKTSLLERNPAHWVARHGSVTFNQFGKSPHDNMPPPAIRAEAAQIETRRCLAAG